MIWLLPVLFAFVTGLALRSPWTVALWPAVSVGAGVAVVANEARGYDMHGFGYYLGGIAAVASVAAWFAGRAVRKARGRKA
jgi:hypothetical protein